MIPANDGVIGVMNNVSQTFETGVGIAATVMIALAFLLVLPKILKSPVSAMITMVVVALAAGLFYMQDDMMDVAKATFVDTLR